MPGGFSCSLSITYYVVLIYLHILVFYGSLMISLYIIFDIKLHLTIINVPIQHQQKTEEIRSSFFMKVERKSEYKRQDTETAKVRQDTGRWKGYVRQAA